MSSRFRPICDYPGTSELRKNDIHASFSTQVIDPPHLFLNLCLTLDFLRYQSHESFSMNKLHENTLQPRTFRQYDILCALSV